MKKTYMQPSVKAIKIQTVQLVMTSLEVDPTTETTTQMSREFDYDEDYEDEEY